MNTTSTAQYLSNNSISQQSNKQGPSKKNQAKGQKTHAAAAPRIPCLFALVKSDKTPENSRVQTSKMAMQTAVAWRSSRPCWSLTRLYKRYIGTISRPAMVMVMSELAQRSMRDWV